MLRLGGGEHVLDQWWPTASAEDRAAVHEALMRVVEGTWRDGRYMFAQDVTGPGKFHIQVADRLSMEIEFMDEFPGQFLLIYLGRPELNPWRGRAP
jgi:hypothetical protein